ncbi:MAG: hypothetical protein ACT4OM_00820 [Actinomycetota bacterium]
MEQARKERLKAYFILALFVAATVVYGREAAPLVSSTMDPVLPPDALIIGAVLASLATLIPLVTTFRPTEAGKLLKRMREKSRRSGKQVTMQSAGRNLSFLTASLAVTPMLYGLAVVFLIGEFQAMLILLPAAVLIAVVGWFVLGRLLKEMELHFLR